MALLSLTPEEVFRLHGKIRWAAFTVDSGAVVFCKMRPGVESHTPEEADRSFMELGPLIITGVSERMTPAWSAGRLESVIINFEKDSILLAKVRGGHLAVSADRADAPKVFQEIAEHIMTLT